jgi:hypothetical protein
MFKIVLIDSSFIYIYSFCGIHDIRRVLFRYTGSEVGGRQSINMNPSLY